MAAWNNDDELFSLMKDKLFTAVVGDILDTLGYTHQFLSPTIKPLKNHMVVAGRAMPVLEADFYEVNSSSGVSSLGKKAFGLMFEALDSLKAHDVYITGGGSPRYAQWGGLMTNRAQCCKAAGAVVNGYMRDSAEVESLDFPIFSMGTYAQDQGARGKVVDYNCPIEFNGIKVVPGDIVFGDRDGVLIVPAEVHEEAISKALEKVATESEVRTAIRNGMSTVEAFNTFGVM